jgi:hypothetical protein
MPYFPSVLSLLAYELDGLPKTTSTLSKTIFDLFKSIFEANKRIPDIKIALKRSLILDFHCKQTFLTFCFSPVC